jgi:hypothetical protein
MKSLIQTIDNKRGSVLPYVVGWLLGVPVSILFLVYLVRAVF